MFITLKIAAFPRRCFVKKFWSIALNTNKNGCRQVPFHRQSNGWPNYFLLQGKQRIRLAF